MTFNETMEIREQINMARPRALFEVHFRGKTLDRFSGPFDAVRLARDISTRFGNQGEPVSVMFRGRPVVEFINGCSGQGDDGRTYLYGGE